MSEQPARRGLRLLEAARGRGAPLLVIAVVALLGFSLASGELAAGATRSAPRSGGTGLLQTAVSMSTSTSTTSSTTTSSVSTETTTTTTSPYSLTTTTSPYSLSTTTTTSSTSTPVPAPPVVPPGAAAAAFHARGMWIWVLADSDAGNLSSIIADAHRYGIGTLIIKSSDGTSLWPQFNATLVQTLHAAHLNVCAWQYVYGKHPIWEAEAGAAAVKEGADCLVIDAEEQYEGRYVQAQEYIIKLRALIGVGFPVALAGFPYVDYHPAFPYSVFLGPGGAQYNQPQMYWQDIGTTVAAVFQHTYEFNELYQRPIAPLGQLFDAPPSSQVMQFRAISRYYGGGGVSWWDWQEAALAQFSAASRPVGSIPGFVADTTVAWLGEGALGDVVVWAQEHLVSAGQAVAVDGDFGPLTRSAVERFQAAGGLPVTGVIDPITWSHLLSYQPVAVTWVLHKSQLSAVVARGGHLVAQVPKSAARKDRSDELAGAGGAGAPDAQQRGPAGPRKR